MVIQSRHRSPLHQASALIHFPILLVHDDPVLRALKRSLLLQAGYQLWAEAVDGVAARECLQASDVPLIAVFSTRMPRLDGAALLRLVAREPWLQRHAYVLNTALAHMLPGELATLVRSLDVAVVGKPFSPDDLLDAVAQAESGLRTKIRARAHR